MLPVAVAVAWAAWWHRRGHDSRPLAELPRHNASNLSVDSFMAQYVLTGTPVIIQYGPDQPLPPLQSYLESTCATRPYLMLSSEQKSLIASAKAAANTSRLAAFLLHQVLPLLINTTIERWEAERLAVRLVDVDRASTLPPAQPVAIAMLEQVARSLPQARHLLVALRALTSPLYLADFSLEVICPEYYTDWGGGTTEYERAVLQKLQLRPPHRSLATFGFPQSNQAKLFFGGVGSESYPLHTDVVDADVWFSVHSGCKAFVVVPPRHRHLMTRMALPGFHALTDMTWVHDLFETPPPAGVTGWRGEVRANEVMYLPGEMLHHVRNLCPRTLAVARRPWRASTTRPVFLERLETLNRRVEFGPNAYI